MNKSAGNPLCSGKYNEKCGICLKTLRNDAHFPIIALISTSQWCATAISVIRMLNNDYPSDIAPPNICKTCFDTLANIYEFSLKCKRAERNIKNYHSNLPKTLLPVTKDIELSDSARVLKLEIPIGNVTKNVKRGAKKSCPRSSRVPCEICKKLLAKGYMRNHMRIHTGEKPYKCESCGKSFSQRTTLTFHELIHTEKRDHMCTYCGKTFKSQPSLRGHVSIHTGEKPFKCEHCGKAFRTRKLLREHRLLHRDEKRYQCEICAKQFKRRYSLQQHMVTHESVKKHVCHLCGNRFTQKHSLKTHLQNSCQGKHDTPIVADADSLSEPVH